MYVTSPLAITENAQPIILDKFEKMPIGRDCTKTFHPGETLFFEGDDADFIYEVQSGVVRTSKLLIDGRRQVLCFGYPGDVIGLSHDELHQCDCEAISEVEVRLLKKSTLNNSLRSDPGLSQRLIKLAAAEVTNMQDHFLMLGRKSAMEKVASFLIVLLDREGKLVDGKICFSLPMKRSDIADFLGLTIETVSRTLTKLRKNEVITLPASNRICVLDSDQLRHLAEHET